MSKKRANSDFLELLSKKLKSLENNLRKLSQRSLSDLASVSDVHVFGDRDWQFKSYLTA